MVSHYFIHNEIRPTFRQGWFYNDFDITLNSLNMSNILFTIISEVRIVYN